MKIMGAEDLFKDEKQEILNPKKKYLENAIQFLKSND